jgi:hypothetical protein
VGDGRDLEARLGDGKESRLVVQGLCESGSVLVVQAWANSAGVRSP